MSADLAFFRCLLQATHSLVAIWTFNTFARTFTFRNATGPWSPCSISGPAGTSFRSRQAAPVGTRGVSEAALRFDEKTRQLRSQGPGKTRRQVKKDRVYEAVLSVISTSPGIGAARLRDAVREIVVSAANDAIDKATRDAESCHLIRVDVAGRGKPTTHWPCVSESDMPEM
jgi:hypothetical protein